MAVFIFASISWVVSARKWFKGPVRTVDDETSSESASEDEKKSASQVVEKEVPEGATH